MASRNDARNAKDHQFGGDWTAAKLKVIATYLTAYTKALKDKPSRAHPFKKAYIDAFAGTGYRSAPREGDLDQGLLFPELAEAAPQGLLDGSARLALQTEPRFDRYIFVDRNPTRCAQLKELKREFPGLANAIDVRHGEANEEIQRICGLNWTSHRAVLFLDPYGMQVEWQTVEAVARTKAIDLWLLFPLGIGVNRLLPRTGIIPDSWQRRLTALLGTEAWREAFYAVESTPDLFGVVHQSVVKAKMNAIARFFVERLKTVFAGVVDEPGVLRNSSNNPLYLLCFASGNERGAKIAMRIAGHLLKELR